MGLLDGLEAWLLLWRQSESKCLELGLCFSRDDVPGAGEDLICSLSRHGLLEWLELLKARRFLKKFIGAHAPAILGALRSALTFAFANACSH